MDEGINSNPLEDPLQESVRVNHSGSLLVICSPLVNPTGVKFKVILFQIQLNIEGDSIRERTNTILVWCSFGTREIQFARHGNAWMGVVYRHCNRVGKRQH